MKALTAQEASGLTAMSRKEASVPCRRLLAQFRIPRHGRVLDFGCGKGKDVEHLTALGFDVTGYDPNHRPERPTGKFETILCTFVMNTRTKEVRDSILREIQGFMAPGGMAFISVRRDIKADGITSRGTYQETVDLAREYGLQVVTENSAFAIYRLAWTVKDLTL